MSRTMANAPRKGRTGPIRNLGAFRPIEDADPEAWVLVRSDDVSGFSIMKAGIAREHWHKNFFVPLPQIMDGVE